MKFFDLTDEFANENSHVVILPVPYEATTSYGKGTARGPKAILEASCQVELYDEELDSEPYLVGISSRDPVFVSGSVQEIFNRIEDAVRLIKKEDKLPVVLGGEHSITPPAVRGAVGDRRDVTVVQLDAHADLRDEYEGTKESHACAMARVKEDYPTLQVGIRSLSKPEAQLIKKENLPVFFAKDLQDNDEWIDKAIREIRTQSIYLTIDVDVFDTSIMPNTGTPEPGGLNWYQVTKFLRKLLLEKDLVGLDIVELSPKEGENAPDFMVAKLLYKCIGYWKKGQKD